MRHRRTQVELLHSVTSVAALAVAFGAGARAYPQGYATIWNIGFVAMAALAGMAVPQLRDAWAADRREQAIG